MSRFKSLLNGLEQAAPQIKGTLEGWAQEMKTLDPVKDKRRMEELSSNIRSTVEANAQRNVPAKAAIDPAVQRDMARLNAYDQMGKVKAGDVLQEGIQVNPVKEINSTESIMKKVAGMGAMPAATQFENPVDQLKAGYNKFESGREKVSDALANTVTGYLPEVSKEKSIGQAKAAMNTATDPLSYAPGFGGVDAVLGAASLLPEVDEETKSRFKGLFGN